MGLEGSEKNEDFHDLMGIEERRRSLMRDSHHIESKYQPNLDD